MESLDAQAVKILEFLVGKLPSVVPGKPETYAGYKEIHDFLDLTMQGETYGDSLKKQGLLALAVWTKETSKPAITGLIVDKSKYMPGVGYFELFGKTSEDFAWWTSEVKRSKSYDWSQFVTPRIQEPPKANDLESPGRVEVTTSRVIRDTALSKRIKSLHNHECQVCGKFIALSDGARYSEAHHIKPLGSPHNGPDVAENLICVCPNHHAELDFAARPLVLSDIRQKAGHSISEEYVRYHNVVLRGAAP